MDQVLISVVYTKALVIGCGLRQVRLFVTTWTIACQSPLVHGIFQARILEWIAIFLLQGTFLIQELNPCLLHLLHWQAGSLPLAPPGKPRAGGVTSLIE